MAPIHVLIVDDSQVTLRILSHTLRADAAIGTISTAQGSQEALASIALSQPDVVVLEIGMPGMGGLDVLREIRQTDQRLPIIMYSSASESVAEAAVEALELGANDFVPKSMSQDTVRVIQSKLLPRIKILAQPAERTLARVKPARTTPAAPRVVKAASPEVTRARPEPDAAQVRRQAMELVQHLLRPERKARSKPRVVRLLAIGASTGGPQALETVLLGLPGNLAVPVVVVQHMPATFTAHLAQQLDARCALRVREGYSGAALAAGDVWIAPGGRHMTVRMEQGGARILLNDGPPEHSCRPAVDVLFRSAVKAYNNGVLAVVLTGMGCDGARGAAAVAAAGGQVIAQDEATSVVWGMPRAVVAAGVASQVLPLDRIAASIRAGVAGRREVA